MCTKSSAKKEDNWDYTISCSPVDMVKAKNAIAALLPIKEGIPMAYSKKALAWLV